MQTNIEENTPVEVMTDNLESAMKQLQAEVEKDWTNVTRQFNDFGSQFSDFGDRLSAAAKAAWEVLTKSKEE